MTENITLLPSSDSHSIQNRVISEAGKSALKPIFTLVQFTRSGGSKSGKKCPSYQNIDAGCRVPRPHSRLDRRRLVHPVPARSLRLRLFVISRSRIVGLWLRIRRFIRRCRHARGRILLVRLGRLQLELVAWFRCCEPARHFGAASFE